MFNGTPFTRRCSFHLQFNVVIAKTPKFSYIRYCCLFDRFCFYAFAGYGPVIEALAEDLDVRLGTVVNEISYTAPSNADNQTDAAHIKTAAGETFSCDALLLTAPLGCLKAGDFRFTPPLPDWKQDVIQRLGYGNLNKVVMQFPTCFWDETVDYFGAAAEEGHDRGNCFMFWNLQVGHASQR
jgi:hypothetical protein